MNNRETMKNVLTGVAVVVPIVTIIMGIIYSFTWEKEEIITVKGLKWEATTKVQELQPQHYTRQISYPMDAYNVHSRVEYSPASKSSTTYYDYTVDEWETVYKETIGGIRGDKIKYPEVKLYYHQREKHSVVYYIDYKSEDGKYNTETIDELLWNEMPEVDKQVAVVFKWNGITKILE